MKKRFFLHCPCVRNTGMFFLFLWIFSCSLYSQSVRETVDFDSDWLFCRYGLQPDGGRIVEPDGDNGSPGDIAFDDSSWRRLDVPHDWGIEGPFREDLDGYTGKLPWRAIGWYRKHFEVPKEDRDKMFFLDFDGVMANAQVYLNGEKIGEQPYGYTSFRVNLTPHIRFDSENVIAVRANTEDLGSRWYPGAGIYRHVRLVKTHKLHIPLWGVFVSTPEITASYGRAFVMVQVTNAGNEAVRGGCRVEIFELDQEGNPGKKVAAATQKGMAIAANSVDTARIALKVDNPHLWDLEHTHLYLARVSVYHADRLTDVYDVPFGFRTLQFTHDNGFLLNGKRVQFKGVCMHHDLGALGTAVNESALERQIRILKSFGANAIRTSHNPPAPELLALADRMGMLVIDEIFDCWTSGKNENDYSVHFSEWHRKDIQAVVCRDRNHPSVIMWSLGNEVEEQYHPEKGMAAYLRDIVRLYDTTRPTTMGASYPSKTAFNGTEFQVDVHGMNYPSGIYGGADLYGKFLDYPGHEHLSGFAIESSSTLSSRGVYFPEGHHVTSYDLKEPGWASLADVEFAALDRYPAICGEFAWTGFDYLGEPTPFNSDASVLLNHATLGEEALEEEKEKLRKIEEERPTSRSSYFGIVDLAGFPKDRYYLYKAHWMPDEPMVHILPHWNFPDRVGLVTPVFVYSSGDEVELFLNGKSLGRKKKEPYQYRFKWEDVIYVPGELKAVAYKNGARWAEACVKTTGEPALLRLSAEKESIRVADDELAFVTVSVCDKEGRMVPTANPKITCELEGDGRIIATDNGDPTSLVCFSATEREAFNGLMLVVIKPAKGARGKLRLTVKSEGLETAFIDIALI